jgi:predicted ATP-grasp superfamily ATP-dependent carboligase
MARAVNEKLVDYYRCPVEFAEFSIVGNLSQDPGYLQFGANGVCYGRSSTGSPSKLPANCLHDILTDVEFIGSVPWLPFDPAEIVENLRLERYVGVANGSKKRASQAWGRNTYYVFRNFLPASWRRTIQRRYFRGWEKLAFPKWPVDRSVEWIMETLMALAVKARGLEKIPFIWFWPDGFQSCVSITHDVETSSGRDFCSALMDLDDSFGIKASFQIVPEGRYSVSEEFLNSIRRRGFEVNVHDYNHDGRLYTERREFLRRAARINEFARRFGAAGFRSGSLYRNLHWYDAFDFSYDMSVPNVGHLEAQRGGCCTIMPYFIGKILEIPLTTSQDYSLFYILGKNSIETWRMQLELIIEKHGLASFNIHPDYLVEEKARKVFANLLEYLSQIRCERRVWMALSGEADRWWRQRSAMRLMKQENGWRIEGDGKERARIAYASLCDDRLIYFVEGATVPSISEPVPRIERQTYSRRAPVVQPTPAGLSNRDQLGALITGADYRGLGVARSLGRRGIPVYVLKRPGHRLAAVSKYVRNSEVWPRGDETQGVDFMLNLAERKGLKGWVLIPTDDEVVGFIARHHDILAKQFCLTIPPWDKLSWGCDKRQLNKMARELHLDQPWTVCPRDREEVARLQCSFPVIIKPALRETYNPLTAAKAWPVHDRPSLIARWNEARSMMAPELIMIQEMIPGWGEAQFSYAALCKDGRPLASVVARRTRQYPMDFGHFSTFVETIDDPGIVQPSLRLLKAARYTGLVEVEFKRDPRDGRFKVLDVNPRVWGWHTLGSRVGVDFAYLLWRMVRDEEVPEVHGGPGGRWIRMNTDLPVAIMEIMRSRLSPGVYFRSLRRSFEPAIFAADDPIPGLLEMPTLIYLFVRRLLP